MATNDIAMTDGAVSTAPGNISYDAGNDVTLASLNGADVYVHAGLDIIDGGETDVDVIATNAQLVAGNSVGEPDTTNNGPVDTTVATLAVEGATGDVYINETDDLTIGAVGAISVNRVGADAGITPTVGSARSGANAGNNLAIQANGGVTVSNAVLATNGDLLLSALAGNLAINNSVEATLGSASLLATGGITQAAAGDVTTGGSLDVNAQGGDISMTDGAISTAGTNVIYLASGNIDLASVNGTNVRIDAGGNITDAGDTDIDVTGTNVQLVAGGDIGSSANAIETDVGTLAMDATNAFIYEANTVSLGSVAAFNVDRVLINGLTSPQTASALAGVAATGNVVVVAENALTVDSAVATTGGNIKLATNTGNIDINNTVDASGDLSVLSAGSLSQAAAGDMTAGGTLDVQAANGITMTDGAVSTATGNLRYLTTAGDIALASLNGANVRVDAAGSIIDNGETDIDVIATTAQLVAGGSIGESSATGNGPLETTVGTLAAQATAGDIYVSETDDLTIGSVAAINVNRVQSDGTVLAQAGSALAGASAANDLMIEAGNGIVVDQPVLATAGDLLLHAQSGDLAINNTVTATAGNASLLASANVTQAAAGDVTAGGTLDINAQGGDITMTDGAISSATGNARLLATGDIYLASLSGANVRVDAGGSIIDNGDTDVDVIATSAQLVAGNAVGEPQATNNGLLETTVGTLAASAANGGVFIDESDALDIGSVAAIDVQRVNINGTPTTQSGSALAGILASDDVVVRANTDLNVLNAVEATAGNLLLRAQTGNMQISSTVDAGNDLTLQANNGTLTQSAAGDVTAGRDLYVYANGTITMDDGAVSTATGNAYYQTLANLLHDLVWCDQSAAYIQDHDPACVCLAPNPPPPPLD